MSFYGSVYYQLVDAFYKIVMKNKGKESDTFLEKDDLVDMEETAAVGRKGVFGFDTGNKWIDLKQVQEERPEAKELYTIYEIYHGKPDELEAEDCFGFKARVGEERVGEDGVIQLDFHDEFETYETARDAAGHVIIKKDENGTAIKKTYRLPKGEVNDRVDRLEELVGTDEGREMPKKENPDDQNLYGYVEDNCRDISLLQEYMGDWELAAPIWKPDLVDRGVGYAPTIADTIGNLDNLYASYSDRANYFKSFVEIIGKLPNLYDNVNEKNPISLCDALVKLKQDLEAAAENLQLAINGLGAQIGEPMSQDSIYVRLAGIYEDIEAIENILNWASKSEQNLTVSGEIDKLITRASDLEAYRTEMTNTTLPAINLAISTLQGETEAHYEIWSKASEDFEKTHNDIYTKLGDVPEQSDIMTIMANKEEGLYNLIGEIDEGKTVKSIIDDVITSIGTVPTDKTVMGIVDDNQQELKDLIGTIPTDKTVSDVIANNHNEINSLIGTVPEDLTIQGQIEEVAKNLGDNTHASENKTAFSLIDQNITDILNLKNSLGNVGENDENIVTQIANIHNLMGEQVDNKSLSVRITENKNAVNSILTDTLSGYVTAQALADAKYATEENLSKVQAAVEDIVGDLNLIEDVKSNMTSEDTTLLQDIFNRLVALEGEIKNIKTVVNNLHSDNETAPFPEVNDTEEPGEDTTE